MSVIVKNMDMPDSCYECRMRTDYGFCSAMPKEFCGYTDDKKRIDWCPLVEIHKDARLIDANKLIDDAEWYGERATYYNPMPDGEMAVSVKNIENAPSILEDKNG